MIPLLLALILPVQDASAKDIAKSVDQLDAGYQDERLEAFELLEKAGKGAEEALAKGTGHADFRVRRACLELLTKLKSPRAVQQAAKMFREDEKSVRGIALTYLETCGKVAEDFFIVGVSNSPLSWLGVCTSDKSY